jgi:hydroxymethylglutaryl-CoA lyase
MEKIVLHEVCLRDGIQGEKKFLDFDLRLALIHSLADAGIGSMQVASFVNPTKIPQMAGIEDFINRIPEDLDLRLSGLVLNTQGLERLLGTKLQHVDLSLSLHDEHGQKNAGKKFPEALHEILLMTQKSIKEGLFVRVGLQCSFGLFEGDPPPDERLIESVKALFKAGADHICLADTTGLATPASIDHVLNRLFESGPKNLRPEMITLHLHDTYGLGMVNFMAAWSHGIRSFDTSLGGLGGCPFVKGAGGNIATQDVVYLCESLGIVTGINRAKLQGPTQRLEQALATQLPSRIYQLQKYREKNLSI